MTIPFILSILAALCVIPILVAGAMSDIKTRTFPKEYWVCAIPAGVFTTMQYLWMIVDGQIWDVTGLLGISIASIIIFLFMGLRFGSGGDWRALMYIGIISPVLIVQTCILSLFAGVALALWYLGTVPKGTKIISITIPFAVAILAGYTSALVIWILLLG
jgi:hypothetical protein